MSERRVSRRTFVNGVAGTASLAGIGALTGSGSVAAVPRRRVAYTTVFERGEGGYHTYRIPAVVRAADGSLLAFAEGRVASASDDGDIDLVMKRSTDGGRTWGPVQVVIDDGANKFGNPVPILDRDTGRIVLNTTRTGGSVSSEDVLCGRASAEDTRRSFVNHSDDNGLTWSEPVEITADVKLDNWRHFVGGPCHGIQLRHGPHAGRMVIPGNHSIAPPDDSDLECGDGRLFGGHSLYSDDGGATWHLGGIDTPTTGVVNPNETSATELADGTVYFSTRDQGGQSPGRRAYTTSSDGGASFDAPYRAVDDINTTQIQGSVLKLVHDRRRRVVFSAPAHPTARENLTIWSSRDATEDWDAGTRVHDGPSGYSDLVELDGRTLGVLFENGERLYDETELPYHHRITFARVPLDRVDDPAPRPATTRDESGHRQHAAISGSPAVVAGRFGRGLRLAGDYLELALTDGLAFDDGPFTAAAWFRTDSAMQQAIFWAHASITGEPKWWVRLEPDQNRIRALLEHADASQLTTAPGAFADGQWHHVALVRGADATTLYVDGAAAGTSAPFTGSVSAGARAGIRIGARIDGVNNPVRGDVDEVWMFDRDLTSDEVAALADSNTAPDGAVLHLPLSAIRR
jgi:BNR repeat-like domain/Concanavalin A-like lectin/glucanases superfamily